MFIQYYILFFFLNNCIFCLPQNHNLFPSLNSKNKNNNNLIQKDEDYSIANLVDSDLNGNIEIDSEDECKSGHECIPFYLCKKDNTVNAIGEGMLDIRIDSDEDMSGSKCHSYMETCCAIDQILDKPPFRGHQNPLGCGYRNINGIGFKITGDKNNETQYGEFPWMIAILKEEIVENEIFNIYQCGGSLIHPSVVLTASHCVDKQYPNELKVRAGEWDTATKDEILPDQDRDVVDIVMHPMYHKGGLFNDIAILFLASPFELADNVQPVCLPPIDLNFEQYGIHSTERCFATGWGKNNFGQAGKFQVILKKIDLPIVPHRDCESMLRTTRLGKYFQLHPSFLCAGGEIGKDTCKGDGGSPLVCPINGTKNRFYQAGIVAWGIGCGDAIPGVYVSISSLRIWIDSVLAQKNIDNRYYLD